MSSAFLLNISLETSSQAALIVAEEIGDQAEKGRALNNLGFIYQQSAQYQRALEQYQQAFQIVHEIGDQQQEGTILSNLGEIYRIQGEYPQALKQYQQALAIQQQIGDRAGEGATLSNLGGALYQSGQLEAAENTLSQAIDVLESLRDSDLTDVSKIALFDTQTGSYAGLQQVLITQNKPEKTLKALEVAERGRGRAFAELVAERLPAQTAANLPDLAMIRQIAQQQNATLVQYSIIDTQVGDTALYIWVIPPTGEIQFRSVDLSKLDQPLSKLVAVSRETIGVRGREPAKVQVIVDPEAEQQQQEQQRQRLQQLSQLLIDPITPYLPSDPSARVIFIPQGELFLVPFPALIDAQGQYLIENHTILTAPSIQILRLTHQLHQQTRDQSSGALVVGNPLMPTIWSPNSNQGTQLPSLPGAEREAEAIADQLGTEPLMWEQASESTVVQQMAKARIIHLATHGLLEYGEPQESGVRDFPGAIALAPSGNNDGLLTSSEILQMKLNAELVVLSACDTGQGRLTGDGVIGLSRALITAGAPSVMVSLWSVPDAPTAELMVEFYKQWQQNPDKAQALRQAMLITMKTHPNPRDWAAFTLIGEAN